MKAFSSLFVVAGLAFTMASCSSVDEPATLGNSDITISVKAPVAEMGRAAITLPEGYTMHCLMQLLDEQNNAAGEIKSAVIDPATGTGSFVITAADQEAGVKALFWAEYIDAAGKSVYNTADLKAVTYSVTEFDLANTASIAATDAFCGKLDALKDGANVTLTRPFANINFTPNNPDKVAAAKHMTVTYAAPAAYNVFDATATATADLTFTNAAFDAAATPWFSTFVFAPVDVTALQSDIAISLSEGLTQTITIEKGNVPLNQNFQINVSATIGDVELSDITIGVGVDPGYNKPEAPKFKVGGYVNAAGEPVATAAEAAGIVFQMGAMAGDNAANYDARFAGKTIKGYAVALENVNPARQRVNDDPITGLSKTEWINGAQGASAFATTFAGSPFVTTFDTWKTEHAVSGYNVTDWYVPTFNQLFAFMGMIFPTDKGVEATGSAEFKALFPETQMFDRDPFATVFYGSCSINDNGNVSAVRLNYNNGTINITGSQMTVATSAKVAGLCRPMITIFE